MIVYENLLVYFSATKILSDIWRKALQTCSATLVENGDKQKINFLSYRFLVCVQEVLELMVLWLTSFEIWSKFSYTSNNLNVSFEICVKNFFSKS